jgi:hypothetical protein
VALYRQALAADPKNQALLTKLTIITTQHARALNDLGRTEEARPQRMGPLPWPPPCRRATAAMPRRPNICAMRSFWRRSLPRIGAISIRPPAWPMTCFRQLTRKRRSGTETNNATLEQANLARLVLAAVALNRQNKAEAAQHYAMVHAAVAKRDLRAAGSANIIAFVSALGGLGQIAPNAGHWQKLLTALQQAGGAPPAVTVTVQARALIAANRADEGWALVRRLQQAGYAHPDFVAAFPLARDPQNSGAPSPRAR